MTNQFSELLASDKILMHHIRATLPDIKARIAQQLSKYSTELKALGGAMGETNPVSGYRSKLANLLIENMQIGKRRLVHYHRILLRIQDDHRWHDK